MKRRNFLKIATPAVLSPFVLNGYAVQTFANLDMLACEGISERVLVLIQLGGGNDGVNTIVPINQYDTYRQLRPNIGLSNSGSNAFIPLDNTLALEDQVGLHPSMTGIKDLYDSGLVNVVQGVSYDNHNRSHFKSTDLWLSGGDGTSPNFNHTTGWTGRYLDYTYPGMAGNPTDLMPDPLGIQLGDSKPSLGFHTAGEHAAAINLSGQDLEGFFSVVSELGGLAPTNIPNTEFGNEIEYIMNIQNSVSNYAERITQVFNAGQNAVTYPDVKLADQLKTVARLMSGGCKTKVYLVKHTGFDTHAGQTESNTPHIGRHADLLNQLSESVKAFMDDLQQLGLQERVLTATFSEFGRKPTENGNLGTDHGEQAPMFLFGQGVQAGVTGTNVDLLNLNRDQLQNPQYDYRQVFTTILQDWLGASNDALDAAYFSPYIGQKLPIIAAASIVPPECYEFVPLPAVLTYFDAYTTDGEVVELEWGTSSELNLERFDIERSADGKSFKPIDSVPAAGSAESTEVYYALDESPLSGLSYYRLKQVDYDGSFQYSEVRTVEIKSKDMGQARLYPNPAVAQTQLTLANESGNILEATIQVLSVDGRLVQQQAVRVQNGFNKIPISLEGLLGGQYFVKITAGYQSLSEAIPLIVRK